MIAGPPGATVFGTHGTIEAEVAPMGTTIKAVYEDGVFKPKEPVSLEEHTELEVMVSTRPPRDLDDPTGWKAIDSLIGILKGTPPDVSENHDAYIYRKPGR